MAREHLTDRRVRSILANPPESGRIEVWDDSPIGLGLRIAAPVRDKKTGKPGSPTATWQLFFRTQDKRQQRLKLGRYPTLSLADAREQANKHLRDAWAGKDPKAEQRASREAATIEQVARDFIADQQKRGLRSADRQERILNRDVLPKIGKMKARDLRRADVKALLKEITERPAPVLANRVHEVVRKMLNWAVDEEVLDANCAERIARNPETPSERFLSLEEIPRYWRELDNEKAMLRDMLRLCLLTAQRPGQVASLTVDQIDFKEKLWICPATMTKTAATYVLPLGEMSLAILRNLTPDKDGRYFPKRGGDGPVDATSYNAANRAACARAGIEGFTPHKARHTFSTHAGIMGFERHISERLLGHAQNGMANRYSQYDYLNEKRELVEAWGARIAGALAENVLPMEPATRKKCIA